MAEVAGGQGGVGSILRLRRATHERRKRQRIGGWPESENNHRNRKDNAVSVAIIDVPPLQLHEKIDRLVQLERLVIEYRALSLAMLDIIDAAARNGWDGTLAERETVRELERMAAKGEA